MCEYLIKERNWIWWLGKFIYIIEEKNYEDILFNIFVKLIKELYNNER